MTKSDRPRRKALIAAPARTAHCLYQDLRSLIESARSQVAQTVNAGLVLLHWGIGDRIRREVLQEQRARYGEEIVSTVSRQLTVEYGPGFSAKNLFHMLRFAEAFPDRRIVSTLSGQLGWSHSKEIIYFDDRLRRDFCAEMCRIERWSVRARRKMQAPRLRMRPPKTRGGGRFEDTRR